MRSTTLRLLPLVLLAGAALGPVSAARRPGTDARAAVAHAMDAVGGAAALRGLRTLRLEGFREQLLPSIAEGPAMPGLLTGTFSEVRDVRAGLARRSLNMRMVQRPDPISYTMDLSVAGSATEAAEEIDLAPERILLLAHDAPDLRSAADTVIDGRLHHVVVFGTPPVRLYMDASSGLPWGWSRVRAYPDDRLMWAPFGAVRTRVRYGAWSLEPGALRYPRMQRTFRNGSLYRTVGVTRLAVNPTLPADSLPQQPTAGPPRPDHVTDDLPVLARGDVVFIPGPFNCALVRQPDGVVVLEAPESAAYSALVLAEAHRRFPTLPVKAVVATTAAWPHVAGLPEYRRRGIAIYGAPGTARTLEALTSDGGTGGAASAATEGEQASVRAASVHLVRDSVVIGDGPSRIVVFRPRATGSSAGPGGLLVSLPGPGLLYGGDMYIPRRFEPNLWSQKLVSLTSAVEARGIRPQTLIALHVGPTPWADVLAQADSVGAPAP